MDKATLAVEPAAVKAVAEKAHKLKTGARGARSVLEGLLKTAMFEVPEHPGSTVTLRGDLTVTVERAFEVGANDAQAKVAA